MSYEFCPVCKAKGVSTWTGQLKMHLKSEHGYIYTEASPNMPVAPESDKINSERISINK